MQHGDSQAIRYRWGASVKARVFRERAKKWRVSPYRCWFAPWERVERQLRTATLNRLKHDLPWTPKDAKAFLVRHALINQDGSLPAKYGGEEVK